MLAKKFGANSTAPSVSTNSDELTPPRSKRGASLLKGVVVSLVSTVVALGLIEIAFRLFFTGVEKAAVSDIPRYDYLPEGAYQARDYYYPPEKAPGVFRIIAVGDSFTFGGKMHFDDSFSKRLERMLNLNEHQRKVEVLNWGISGYSTVQEAELVQQAMERYNPDLIIVQITLNDAELQPYRVTHKYQNERGKVVLSNPILKYWKSLGYFVRRIYYTKLNQEYITYHTASFENPDSWNLFAGAFRRIHNLTAQRSVPLLAVLFPMMSHPFNENYPFHAVHKKISKEMGAQKIAFVDLLPDFKDKNPVRMQVEPGSDPHPNEIAHRMAADRIYTTLLKLEWLPEDVEIKKYSKRMHIRPTAVKPVAQPSPAPIKKSK